ncbi:MAG TPA: hypothetical protein ENH03_03025, partial [Candidatus Bathyarchaeota archaeon]|nr:hypothetical protein [Candidatus Bathyarchaeota archaeon]
MQQKSLMDFCKPANRGRLEVNEQTLSKPEERNEKTEEIGESLEEEQAEERIIPENLPPSYFVSAGYDGRKGLAYLKLYEPVSQRIYFWYDNTGHKPYLLTNIPPEELEKLERVINHPGFDHFEVIEKYDALYDRKIKVTKVIAKDPLAIGGRRGSLRDL